jgi:hypothetical protein
MVLVSSEVTSSKITPSKVVKTMMIVMVMIMLDCVVNNFFLVVHFVDDVRDVHPDVNAAMEDTDNFTRGS